MASSTGKKVFPWQYSLRGGVPVQKAILLFLFVFLCFPCYGVPDEFVEMGNYYMTKNNWDPSKAIEYYNKAIELNDKNSVAWNNIGNALFNLKKYEEALPYFEKSIELWPKGGSQDMLAWCFMELKKYEKAIEVFNQHNAILGTSSYRLVKMGYCYLEIGKNQEALSCASEAIQMGPNDPRGSRETHARAWYVRGKAYLNLGKTAEALHDFDEALKFDPSCQEAFEASMKARSESSGSKEGKK